MCVYRPVGAVGVEAARGAVGEVRLGLARQRHGLAVVDALGKLQDAHSH